MKKGFSFLGFIFIVIVGTLLHFLYAWSGNNAFVGAFAAVNESTWEHLKIFYWPFLIFSAFEYFKYGKDMCGFFSVKLKSLSLSLGFIIVFFYTYQGILGFNVDFLNILDFVLAAAIGRLYESGAKPAYYKTKWDKISLIIMLVMGLLFILFTYKTPQIGLFMDPRGFYGIGNL